MRPYRITKDAADHFVIDDGSGRPFRVAKKGLGDGVLTKIQSFASGGEVKKEEEAAPTFIFAPPPTDPMLDPLAARGVRPPLSPSELPPTLSPEAVVTGLAPPQGVAPMRAVSLPAQPATPAPAPAPQPAPEPQMLPGQGASAPAIASPPRVTSASSISRAEKDQLKGVQAEADALQAQAAAEAVVQQEKAQKLQEMTQRHEARMAEHQRRSDELYNNVLNSKIDPTRMWSNLSTGQKVAASIGLILGGIGGRRGGPNMAIAALDKAIDRDIDAQRVELGKKENLLNHYMQQGREMRDAHSMAKADFLDVAAAQLQQASARFGGQRAQAEAQKAAGVIRMQAAGLRQQAEANEFDRWYKLQQLGIDAQKIAAQAKGQGTELFVPMANAFALDKDAAKIAREAGATHAAVTSNLDELIRLREKYGSTTIPDAVAKRMKTLAGTVKGGANRFYKFGALDKGADELLTGMMGGDPGDYGYVLDGLKEMRKALDAERDSQYDAYLDPRSHKSTRLQAGEFGARKVGR